MNTQTSTILKKCGIQPHLLGYEYLGEAIELISKDRNLIHETSELYFTIAERFDSTYSRVERSIRHAITVAFNNLSPDIIQEVFGNTLNPKEVKPTNAHFIAAVAELIRCDGESR